MSLFSIFTKTPPEPTSVAEALAGSAAPARSTSRRTDSRADKEQSQQLMPEKKRARRRLIGAVAIVLAVVIGLPMLLDSEPKPLNKNINIQIPSRDAAPALAEPREERVPDEVLVAPRPALRAADQAVPAPVAVTPAPLVASIPAVSVPTVVKVTVPEHRDVVERSTEKASDDKPVEKQTEKPTEKHADKVVDKPVAKKEAVVKPKAASNTGANDDARALAILDGGDSSASSVAAAKARTATNTSADSSSGAASDKFVLQVGAFATQEKVSQLQSKLSAAGIKSYTQKVATSSGDKIRVRIGPFADRDAAARIKAQCEKLGLVPTLIPQ